MDAHFDGYTVELFQEDEEWLARLEEMPTISAFAPTPEAAVQELREVWRLAKETWRDRGQEVPTAPSQRRYSGQFNVRIDKRLHRDLATEAARSGISLNALVARKLAG